MKLVKLFTISLALSICFSSTAQSWQDTLVILNKIMQRYSDQAPGAQVSISRNGELIYSASRGLANLEYKVPLTNESKIEAGSVSKQFTAAAILLLEQSGKLSVKDDIRKYIPEIRDYGATITIEHLIHHTSGLKDWGSIAELSGWPRGTKAYNNEDALDIIIRQTSLNNLPGAEFIYSNTNYNLQAIIVQRVSGLSLAAFTKQFIFEPAGMKHTEWRDNYKKVVVNRATAYSKSDNLFIMNMPNENAYGNGGLLTTTEDLLKWNRYYLSNQLGSAPLLTTQLKTIPLNNGQYNNYAVGLFIDSLNGWYCINHNGVTAGYRANLEFFPDLKLSIAWLSNNADRSFADIPNAIRNVMVKKINNEKENTRTTPKVEPIDTSWMNPVYAKSLEGFFFSEETKSGNRIAYKENVLTIEPEKGSTWNLEPLKKDHFNYPLGTIAFIRNKKGMVDGFYISISRARNVLFVKKTAK
jgi:CubicO group peptidase (beta-lactamase class C family)